jgi:phosphoribosylamine--glycine ligase
VYHAGTRQNPDAAFETNGGRVLALSHTGATREEARNAAYEELRKLSFNGCQIRRDIATLHFE